MILTKEQEDKLMGRLLQCLKEVYEPITAIRSKKGKNLPVVGISVDEKGNSLKPEKYYELLVTPELKKVSHYFRVKAIINESTDLQELHTRIIEYYNEYKIDESVKFKYPKSLNTNI